MIELRHVSLSQGLFHLQDISFKIEAGSYAVMMGKTGSGKTSVLEMIAGLRLPQCGDVLMNGKVVTRHKPGAREIGYTPQDAVLFPKMSVRDNLCFGLSLRGIKGKKANRLIEPLTEILGITHLLKRLPSHLSGGEKQRVSLGRALAFKPKVLLLDEPLSALDENTHEQMVQLLRSIHRELKVTVLHVSHRQQEAEALADVILKIEGGEVHQQQIRFDPETRPIQFTQIRQSQAEELSQDHADIRSSG